MYRHRARQSLIAGLVGSALLSACAGTGEPPTLTITESPYTVDDIVLELSFQDPAAGEGRQFDVTWTRNGEPVDSASGGFVVPASQTARGESWEATVRELVKDEPGEDAWTATTVVLNTAPEGSVEIQPAVPEDEDDLVAVGSGTDIDGDEVSFRFEWSVGGEVQADLTGDTVPADRTERGDVWTVTGWPTDGSAEGEPSEATVNIANEIPVATAVTLTPEDVFERTVVRALPEGTDPDGDEVSWRFVWSVDGAPVDGVPGDQLTGEHFGKGQEITVQAFPSDGFVEGSPVTSAGVTVQNTAPELALASVSKSLVREGDTVTCVGTGWLDVDGDPESYRTEWLVNGGSVGTSDSLDGASFDRGDRVACTLTPNDGEVDGTPVTSSEVVIENTAPVLGGVTIDKSSPTEGDTLSVVMSGAFDADGDDIIYTYSWIVNGSVAGTGPTLSSDAFDKGDTISVEVTPDDDIDLGTPAKSPSVKVVNSLPVVTSITLSPTDPLTDDTLTAAVSGTDADGDTITYSYSWAIDGTAISAPDAATLAGSSWFDKGDKVTVTVTPNDGEDDGSADTSAAVTVGNSLPSIASVAITPSTAREGTTLTCSPAGWSDDDGDSEGYTWAWTVNGSAAGTSKTLTSADFDKGDAVICTATPFDGTDSGTAVSSSAITVLNTAPVLSGVTLSSTSPKEGDTLSVTLGSASDADGDSITYRYDWQVNGTSVSTASTLPSSSFDRGDTIVVEVTPYDGEDTGTAVKSATATAVNTPPVISAVTLSPSSPKTTDAVTATVSASDADGDKVSYTYAWYVDGTKVSATTATLAATEFDKDEEVYVIVTPSDGTDTGAAFTSSKVTVANTPPSITGVSIAPSKGVREGTVVTCTPTGWSDDDKDAEGYTWAWTVNGKAAGTTKTLASTAFDKGDLLACTATPFDGDDSGKPITSASVKVENTPPTLKSATLSSTSPKEGDTLTVTPGGAADADGDTVTYRYDWQVNGTTAATSAKLPSTYFKRGDTIVVELTPYDGEDTGTAVKSATATVANSAPVISAVTLSPSAPKTTESVSATVTASDADGDKITYAYVWYVDGATSKITSSTLPSTEFVKKETVWVEVTPTDGTDKGKTFTSGKVTVANTPPSITSAAISPARSVREKTVLTCVPTGWSDDDKDAEGYTWSWTVGGSPVGTSKTLTGSAFDKGDVVVCTATPFDGDDSGKPVASTAVKVENTPPSLKGVTLSTTSPKEGDTITATPVSPVDDDGDKITYLYDWQVNGASVSKSTSLTSKLFDKGDSIQLFLTPNDGTDNGTTVSSTTIKAVNSAPVISGLSLSPGKPTTDTDLTLSGTYTDADGDKLSVTYAWTLSDEGTSGFTTVGSSTATLSSSLFDKDDVVRVRVTVSDGTAKVGPIGPADVTIGNTAPTEPIRVSLSPDPATPDDALTCGWGASKDADGDKIVYTVRWILDGSTDSSVKTSGTSATLAATATAAGDTWECGVTAVDTDSGSSKEVVSDKVPVTSPWDVLSAGFDYGCGIVGTKLFCWGENRNGELGDGTTTTKTSPTPIGSLAWSSVDAGVDHTCGITTKGELFCWGDNTYGQIGDGTSGTGRTKPVQVGKATDWVQVATGWIHTCAVNTSGAMYCWGNNSTGQLGAPVKGMATSPVLVNKDTDWTRIAAGYGHTCAIKKAGSMYCWGFNADGQLGISSTTSQSSPMLVGRLTDWTDVSATYNNTCGIRSSGVLMCWGDNGYGQVGDGSGKDRTAPVALSGAWDSVSSGPGHTCGINTSGALYCWGLNSDGQIGDASTTSRTTPTRVGSASSWDFVSAGADHTYGLRTSGSAYAWGGNAYGQLGTSVGKLATSPQALPDP